MDIFKTEIKDYEAVIYCIANMVSAIKKIDGDQQLIQAELDKINEDVWKGPLASSFATTISDLIYSNATYDGIMGELMSSKSKLNTYIDLDKKLIDEIFNNPDNVITDLNIKYNIVEYQQPEIEKVTLTEEQMNELGIPLDNPNLEIYQTETTINGITIPSYFVYDKSSGISIEKLMDTQRGTAIYTGRYYPPELLTALKDKGYKIVYDLSPESDAASPIDKNGQKVFWGAAWCAAWDQTIKIHYFGDWSGDYTNEALVHEMGHAVDCSLVGPQNSELYYGNVISKRYNEGKPMFLRLADKDKNDGYITIEYDENGAYVIDNGNRVSIDITQDSEGGYSLQEYTINGNQMRIASSSDADGHACEVAAEFTRYTYVDQGELLTRAANDPTYQLVSESLIPYFSENFGTDTSYWKEF